MQQKDSVKDYLLEIPNYLSNFIFAMFFLTLSPILIDISNSTSIDIGDLNLIFTFFTIGSVVGQLTSVLYTRRFSSLTILVASFIFLIPVTVAKSLINNLYGFYILYFISGYVLGLIWIQANHNIMRSRINNKDRLTAIALSFYPLGAFAAPYISSFIVGRGVSWQNVYYVLIGLIILAIILYLTITRRMKYLTLKPDEKISFKEIFTDRSRNIIFFITLVMLITYTITETIVATWAPTFFRAERAFSVGDAALIISLFWLGILAGRTIVGIFLGKIKAYYLLLILSALAIISAVLIYFFDSRTIILIMIFIIGLGYSAIFPLLVSSGSNIYKLGRGVLLTIIFAVANLGISLAPYLTRFLSKYSMLLSISMAPVFMVLFFLLNIIIIIFSRSVILKRD